MLPGETITSGAPDKCPECHTKVKLMVMHSQAGYYIGSYCKCGPYSRESDYYPSREAAQADLDSGAFGR